MLGGTKCWKPLPLPGASFRRPFPLRAHSLGACSLSALRSRRVRSYATFLRPERLNPPAKWAAPFADCATWFRLLLRLPLPPFPSAARPFSPQGSRVGPVSTLAGAVALGACARAPRVRFAGDEWPARRVCGAAVARSRESGFRWRGQARTGSPTPLGCGAAACPCFSFVAHDASPAVLPLVWGVTCARTDAGVAERFRGSR